MTINLETRAPALADELASGLDDALQIAAASAGWTNTIELVAKDGKLSLAYETGKGDQIFDEEYGKPGVSPNAVIRPFLNQAKPVITRAMEDEALTYLFSTGILP